MKYRPKPAIVVLLSAVLALLASCALPQASAGPGADIADAVHDVAPSITAAAVVVDRQRNTELAALDADRQFRSASVVKLLIAIDTLRRTPAAADRVARMLTYSDNHIASALWVAGDGSEIVRRGVRRIGLRHTTPPENPGQWGDTRMSARDVVAIYRYILTDLPELTRTVIVDALAATTRRAADGWNQYFGIPSGIDRPWAVKQGWGSTARNLVLHSTGLVGDNWRYIVVLCTEQPRPARWAGLRRALNAATVATAGLVT